MKLPNYQDYYPYILKFGDEKRGWEKEENQKE